MLKKHVDLIKVFEKNNKRYTDLTKAYQQAREKFERYKQKVKENKAQQ